LNECNDVESLIDMGIEFQMWELQFAADYVQFAADYIRLLLLSVKITSTQPMSICTYSSARWRVMVVAFTPNLQSLGSNYKKVAVFRVCNSL